LTDTLRVGQFAIVDHEPVDRGPNAGIFHGRGPHDDRAELFVVAEGTTPAGEAFAGHVISALGQAFTSLDMSLTGALRRLFLEADQNVRDWNARSIAQHRVSLGLSCFGRRGAQAVIAQAGPTVAYHLSGRQVTAYSPGDEHARAIGTASTIPQLTRINLTDGDRVLLISTAALQELDDEVIGGILALPEEQVLADLYHRLSHLRHLTALLVTTADAPADTVRRPSRDQHDEGPMIDATGLRMQADAGGNVYQPHLFIEDEGADAIVEARRHLLELRPRRPVERALPALSADAPVPLQRASGDGGLAVLAAESQARAAHSRELLNSMAPAIPSRAAWVTPAPAPSGGGVAVAEPPVATGGDGRPRRNQSFSRSLLREEVRVNPSPVTTDAPPCDELAQDARVRAELAVAGPMSTTLPGDPSAATNGGGTLVRMRGDMGGRWKPTGGGRTQVAGGQFPPTWAVIVVGLSLLVALVAIMVGPSAFGADDSDRYTDLVDGAAQQLAAARAVPDLKEQREALTAASAMLLEAQEIDAAALAETNLMAEVDAEIALLDDVRTPQAVESLASLEQFGEKPVSVMRMAIAPGEAYLLDSSGNQVIAVSFETAGKEVVFAGNDEADVGSPVALAYLDESAFAGAALLIADNNGSLWAYGANGVQPVAFAAPQNLTVADIATHEGDLYVLDAQAHAIYQFAPAAAGFTNAPTVVLDTPDLAAARRLMVDGEIVTADADGTLRRFTNQVSLELSQAGIDKPLVKDDLVQPVEARGDLAVLDPPNDRIVVFRRDGTFDRQFKHKDLQSMTAFVIDDGVAYVFAGGWLRRVTW
jgi:hypothetical protein